MILFLVFLSLLSSTVSLLLPDLITTAVERVDLENSTLSETSELLLQITTNRKPIIVTGYNKIKSWKAFEKWKSPKYLSSAFYHETLPVKVSDQPVFTLYALDAKRGSNENVLQGGEEHNVRGYKFQNITLMNALYSNSSVKDNNGKYKYYAGRLPPLMQEDVRLSDLVVKEVDKKMSRGIVWLGNKGVTAQTHYDRSFNMFVQVIGSKSFYLFPPSGTGSLFGPYYDDEDDNNFCYLHPSYSGSRRQCRYTFPLIDNHDHHTCGNNSSNNNECSSRAPSAAAPSAMLATLQPGELLYVPPFYFHTVVSLSPQTLSYSVLSPSSEEFFYSSALYAQVNFLNLGKRGSRRLRLGVKMYIDRILMKMKRNRKNNIAHSEMQSLYHSRHAPLKKNDDNDNDNDKVEFYCSFKSKIEKIRVTKLLGKETLRSAVTNVTNAFEKIHIVSKNVGVGQILLHDLIEELLVFATTNESTDRKLVDNNDRVGRLIRDCWTINGM